MTIHFHLGNLPITFSLTKGEGMERELEEKTAALVELALRLPVEGACVRYVLRRWAEDPRGDQACQVLSPQTHPAPLPGSFVPEQSEQLPDWLLQEAKGFLEKRLQALELSVTYHVRAALSRHDQLNYDLKSFNYEMNRWAETFSLYAPMLTEMTKRLGIERDAIMKPPVKGEWKLSAPMYHRKGKARQKRIDAREPSWKKEAAEQAKKLRSELPPRSSIPDLVRRFGVSYNKFATLIGREEIKVIREGSYTLIPREEIALYVERHGIPQPKTRHYGGLRV